MSFANMLGRFPNQQNQLGMQARTPEGFGQFSNITGGQVPGYTTGTTQRFTPEQMQLFQNMFSMVQPNSFLGGLASGDQGQFQALEYPALSQFNKLAGGLGSRFSGGHTVSSLMWDTDLLSLMSPIMTRILTVTCSWRFAHRTGCSWGSQLCEL